MCDETTLLPCPFCGGDAKLIKADRPSYTPHSEGWYVICKCGASLGFHGNDDEYNTYGDFPHELRAIQAWNTRAGLGNEREKALEQLVRDIHADELNNAIK